MYNLVTSSVRLQIGTITFWVTVKTQRRNVAASMKADPHPDIKGSFLDEETKVILTVLSGNYTLMETIETITNYKCYIPFLQTCHSKFYTLHL